MTEIASRKSNQKCLTFAIRPLIALLGMVMTLGVMAEAKGISVAELAARDNASIRGEVSQTMQLRVTYVVSWLKRALLVADPTDPEGPAVFMFGGDAGPSFAAYESLRAGDVIEAEVIPCAGELEPVIRVTDFRIVRHEPLVPPPIRDVGEILKGALNNRRATVRGVVMSMSTEVSDGRKMSLLTLNTSEGPLTVRFRGGIAATNDLRDAEVSVAGIVAPVFNPRQEFIGVVIESLGPSALKVESPAPAEAERLSCSRGVMARSNVSRNLHAKIFRGEVTYVDASRSEVVVQAEGMGVPVVIDGPLPALGETVDVVGFPQLAEDCGILVHAHWSVCTEPMKPIIVRPVDASVMQAVSDVQAELYAIQYRYVEIVGRVVETSLMPEGGATLLLKDGSWRVSVRLSSADVGLFADCPRVRVRGVLTVSLGTPRASHSLYDFRSFTLLTRTADDLEIIADAPYRLRRFSRLARRCLLWSMLPLLSLLAWVLIRRQHERTVARVVSADRRRIASVLHDTIAQYLTTMRLWSFSLRTAVNSSDPAVKQALDRLEETLEATRREVRLAIDDLSDDSFLAATPEEILRRFVRRNDGADGVRVRLSLQRFPERLAIERKRDLLAIVQEATANAIRHGKARNIILAGEGKSESFILRILNDGASFEVDQSVSDGHYGLSNMRERAAHSSFEISFGEWRGYRSVELMGGLS